MYNIIFYEDEQGYSEIVEYIKELSKKSKSNKESRIQYNKTIAYFDALQEMGTRVGEPVTKHLNGEIWELRPLKHRYLYTYYKNQTFIILHHFVKKTKKTPRKELNQAKGKLADYIRRNS